MATKQRINRKKKPTATIVPALQTRPFATPQVPSSSPADLQAQLAQADRLGHRISDLNFAPRSPVTVQPKLAVQPKLTIGAPNDPYEQEADRVAAQVVNQINRSGGTPTAQAQAQVQSIQRRAAPEEEELQMKALIQRHASEEEDEQQAAPQLESAIQQARGGGQALPDTVRRSMEGAFGKDFSRVKIHTSAQSHQLNRSIQARAFTTGQDIFFRQGEFNPGTRQGQELLAHELTHVVQQSGGAVQRKRSIDRKPDAATLAISSTFGNTLRRQMVDSNKQVIQRGAFETLKNVFSTKKVDYSVFPPSGRKMYSKNELPNNPSGIQLGHIFGHPELWAIFWKFAVGEYNVENLACWSAIQYHKTQGNPSIKEILKQFVNTGAPQEINLGNATGKVARLAVEAYLQKGSDSGEMMQKLQDHLESDMLDTLSRFQMVYESSAVHFVEAAQALDVLLAKTTRSRSNNVAAWQLGGRSRSNAIPGFVTKPPSL